MQTLAQSIETPCLSSDPWYVVHAKPRAEARALENLERQGFEVFLPMITLQKVRRARVANITEPMFSRYLFLRVTTDMQDLSVVRSTMGVSQLVRFGQVAAKVPHAWVEAMRAQPLLKESLLKSGDKVVLAQGTLKGLEAIYVQPDGELRAMVLIDLLSRPHQISYEMALLVPAKQ
jgi:transcriptional antiterminator RfaH